MEVHRYQHLSLFTPLPHTTSTKPTSSDLRLALGRAKGDIELCNPLDGAWVHESWLRGGKDSSASDIHRVDLTRGPPSRHSDENYGEIWCLAAQPRPPSSLVAADDPPESQQDAEPPTQDLVYKRLLAAKSTAKARVLSIAYRDRAVVVAGCANSTMRVLDTRSGQLSLNHNHRADILDVAVSADGQMVFSGGMDQRTTAGVSVVPHGMSLSASKRSRPRAASDKGLGAYPRTIGRVAFSADSRILVAGGLDGRFDSWILTDVATSARNERALPGRTAHSSRLWSSNPARDLLPNLPSMPLLLIFRPQMGTHLAGASEDRLVVVTAGHDLWEFNVLAGAFSPFSRRSLTIGSTTGLGEWQDRARGSVWDVGPETERIWIYGSAWLGAFDLSPNAAVEAASPTTCERFDEENGRKLKRSRMPKHTSGAGSRIPGWKRDLRDDAGHDDDDAEGDVAPRWAAARLRHAADAGQHGGPQADRSSGPGSHDSEDSPPGDRAAIWHPF
ncbi:MAG: U3 small nucleolar RNA-associated protein [Phylliscum demangeonii]|nr:MAG: U3 small nucleolar RNA-associated protein [Phylliscum demangeonii]